ncbi:MAG TPA: hypothetical protein VMC41_01495 [Candidatus Nanoarchaeia archaeon]|nr:hypothetical protein [Candidatus Nanoarchaeia archaeon]
MFTKRFIIIMSSIIGALLIFIAALLLWQKYFSAAPAIKLAGAGNKTPSASTTSLQEGVKATENLINAAKKNAVNGPAGSPSQVVTINQIIDGKNVATPAVSIAPGTSPISEKTGEAVAKDGEAAQNSSVQGIASSPTQSVNVDPAKLPQGTFVLAIDSDNKITPNSFTVHPGQAVSLAFTNKTKWSEIIIFGDPSLAAIGFSLLPETTRVMIFNAPAKTGNYLFYSNVDSQRQAGMQGTMIVK